MAGRPSFQSIFRYEIRPLTARCLALTRRSIAYKEKAPTLHRRGRSVTMSCFPLPLFARVSELLDDRPRNGDAADVFDVAARHRLAVGDDGEGFHDGTRIARWPIGVEAPQVGRHLRPTLETPASGQRHELNATTGAVTAPHFA